MSETQRVFDTTASTYNNDRARLIPCHDKLYRWAVDLIPANATHILDLGAGSGIMTEFIRQRFPHARIHLLDFSEPMLALAQQRLGDDPLLTFQRGDYSTVPFPPNLDAIVSALSIHHLDDGAKQYLFYKLHDALNPGGVFINAEQVAGPTPALEARYKHLWLEQVTAAGAKPQQITDSLYRQQDDKCASVEAQLAWMRAAGFEDADCWFKEARFAVLAGSRA